MVCNNGKICFRDALMFFCSKTMESVRSSRFCSSCNKSAFFTASVSKVASASFVGFIAIIAKSRRTSPFFMTNIPINTIKSQWCRCPNFFKLSQASLRLKKPCEMAEKSEKLRLFYSLQPFLLACAQILSLKRDHKRMQTVLVSWRIFRGFSNVRALPPQVSGSLE